MLTLAGSFAIDGYTVFRDVVRRDTRWTPSSTFYLLADRPRLAREADGTPAFDFLRFRLAPQERVHSGGILTLTVELGYPSNGSSRPRDDVVAAIRAALGSDAPRTIELAPLPLVGGRATLTFAAETAGDLVHAIGSPGRARLAGNERATFIVDLTTEGAALLLGAFDAGHDLFHVRYELQLIHVLGNVELRVWCDARSAHQTASARATAGALTPQTLRAALVEQHLAGYELTAEHQLEPAHQQQLDTLGQALLEQVLTEAFLDGSGRVPPWNEGRVSLVNRRYTESSAIVSTVVVEDVFGPVSDLPLGRVRSIDLDRERAPVLDLTIHCTLGDPQDLVETVKATVLYTRLQRDERAEVVFNRTHTTARVRADLGPVDEPAYRIEALAYYRGDADPARLTFPLSAANIAVLDVDGLGVLRVALRLGDVPFDRIRQVTVDLAHEATQRTTTVILDASQPTAAWRLVIRDESRRWRYRTAWVLLDDTRIEEPAQWSEADTLTLHAPDALRAVDIVQLVSAEPFDGVAQIAVALRSSVDDAAVAHRVFSAAGQRQTWSVARRPDAHLDYQVRETVVYADGHVADRDWRSVDVPVLVVKDHGQFVVRILTRLLPFGPDLALALLSLEAQEGPEDQRARATLPLRDGRETRWTFRLGVPDRHRYRYQLTLIPRSGQRTILPWQDATDEVLVLKPSV